MSGEVSMSERVMMNEWGEGGVGGYQQVRGY